jgi:indole-3-acetate monooxygenase
MKSPGSVPGDMPADLSGRVSAFAAAIRARAGEAEQLGTMPGDLADTAKRDGLFTLALPRSLGGLELDPLTIISVVEALSHADGSGGWTAAISNNTVFFAWLEPSVAKEILGADPRVAATCMFTPLGRAVPADDGTFTVSGRWPFSTGCLHADWFQAGMFVMDGAAPRLTADGRPDYRFAFFPREQAQVFRNWDVLGLRGTGSNSIGARQVPVPAEHVAAMFFEPARHDGALWRIPCFTLAGLFLAGFPLGVARRALDEFASLAPARTRAPSSTPLASEPECQVTFAHAEGSVRAARSLIFDEVGRLWDIAQRGDVPDLQARAGVLLALQHAMRACTTAVDAIFTLSGARAVSRGEPLERCFRDIHTGAQHAFFSNDAAKRYAKARFGIEQDTFMI